MNYDAILFDFDGVLLESEYAGNKQIADYLTGIGHPTTAQDSMSNFMGLSGDAFIAALEKWIGRPLPDDFHGARQEENVRVLREGLDPVVGAIRFVRALPADLPRAIVSSSTTDWIATHLDHLGLRDVFGDHIYSGHEHVENGKPAPDIYRFAADRIAVAIDRCVIIEDSPVGVTGAVASGADVIGLCAGSHCPPDHGDRLRALGVERIAHGFDEVAGMVDLQDRYAAT